MCAGNTLFQPQAYSFPSESAAIVCRQPPAIRLMRRSASPSTALGSSWSLQSRSNIR